MLIHTIEHVYHPVALLAGTDGAPRAGRLDRPRDAGHGRLLAAAPRSVLAVLQDSRACRLLRREESRRAPARSRLRRGEAHALPSYFPLALVGEKLTPGGGRTEREERETEAGASSWSSLAVWVPATTVAAAGQSPWIETAGGGVRRLPPGAAGDRDRIQPVQQEREHLQFLSMFYFAVGALAAMTSIIPALGLFIAASVREPGEPLPFALAERLGLPTAAVLTGALLFAGFTLFVLMARAGSPPRPLPELPLLPRGRLGGLLFRAHRDGARRHHHSDPATPRDAAPVRERRAAARLPPAGARPDQSGGSEGFGRRLKTCFSQRRRRWPASCSTLARSCGSIGRLFLPPCR